MLGLGGRGEATREDVSEVSAGEGPGETTRVGWFSEGEGGTESESMEAVEGGERNVETIFLVVSSALKLGRLGPRSLWGTSSPDHENLR